MTTQTPHPLKSISIMLILAVVSTSFITHAAPAVQQDTLSYYRYRGSIIDNATKNPLVYATISVNESNIATISNSEGEFALKIPRNLKSSSITVSYIGYQSRIINISDLKPLNNQIGLKLAAVNLSEVTVFPKKPELLVRAVMNKRNLNYYDNPMLMTAFYRETIKKRRTYVSLSEAVVEILKQPITGSRNDFVQLYKARKSTDYTKLDTVAFKMQGGPHTNLMLDIMRNPELMFSDDMYGNYMFSIDDVTKIGDRLMYVVHFWQRPHVEIPLYYGDLYIDTESLALVSAKFNLNVENREAASQMFLKKKPIGSRVYPTSASYHVDYRETNGKWYYGYSRGDLSFRVSWRKRLFNRVYDSTIEMLVTDWEKLNENPINPADRLKPTVIMADEISGFADPEFWGEYNVIEPEKPIENAIKKIQKSLEKKTK